MATSTALVHHSGQGFFLGISPAGHALALDVNGDRAVAPTPIELLLIAVGGCMGSDIIEILRKMRERVSGYTIEVRGERRTESPRSFQTIHLHHILKGRGIRRESVEQAVQLADTKYCSVAANLRPTTEVSVSFEIVEDPEENQDLDKGDQ